MAGPGDELAAGAGGRGHLRASHADREQVIETLKAAFVQGRLNRDEFGLRVDQTFASRTYAELAAVIADIPARLTGAQRSPELVPESANRKAVKAIACWTAALWSMFAAALMAAGSADGLVLAVVFIPFLVIPLAVLLLFHAWLEKRASRQSSQGLPPGASGQAPRRLPSANPAGELPPADPGHRHTAETARKRRARRPLPVRGPCAGGAFAAGTVPASG